MNVAPTFHMHFLELIRTGWTIALNLVFSMDVSIIP
jgi:hypothetical protein